MNLLMHICCSVCALYPLQTFKRRGISVKGFWFNPNIHPLTEYKNRLASVVKLQELWGLDIEYSDNYGLVEFLRNVVNNEDERCKYCYFSRIEAVAARAKEIGAEAFSTSMLVSPYQNLDIIREAGRIMQEKYDVEFYCEDFRSGFNEGRRMAVELELYRQKYCGCVYSEMERFSGYKNIKARGMTRGGKN